MKGNRHLWVKEIITVGFLLIFAVNSLFAADAERAVTRRFGIFIGSNNGGRDREMLRYAVSDAKSLSRIFGSMGGIAAEDNILLVEPSVNEINRQLNNLGRMSAQSRRNAQRTELVFYYSGHSDENGILLNRERYGYKELRERINTVQADMRIVILDSCSSGAMTRAKGGAKTQPFLFDSSVSAEGYAILTSSSSDEVSQESDVIESSYFTHSLLAGLRGAADSVGDGRVTLNELYRFAYTETLARTETSTYGAQHPSYDIQISGSGDVVLTDIKEISASLLVAEDITGRISIRDSSDFLVAELTKVTNKPMELGLEPGLYRITLQRGDNFYRAEIYLPENKRTNLGMGNFQMIAAATGNRSRGDSGEISGQDQELDDIVPVNPVSFQILPGIDVFGNSKEKATNNFLIGLFVANGHNIQGLGVASIGLINTGYINGIQASGIFSTAGGNIQGIQTSGIYNYAGGNIQGIQAAGIYNFTAGDIQGIQAVGIFNRTEGSIKGIQESGIYSFTGGNVRGIQAAGIYSHTAGDFSGGIQGSGIISYTGGNFLGIQAAGIANYTAGNIQGIQTAGIYNQANEIRGIQAAGIANINRGGNGAMFGLVNVSKSETIIPFGLVNVIENGILHPAIYVDDMLFTNFSFRSGSKYFYTILNFGLGGDVLYNRADDRFHSYRAGIGVEIPLSKLYFDIDMTSGSIYDRYKAESAFSVEGDFDQWSFDEEIFASSHTSTFQLRLTAGYNFFKHLGVFCGISYDYFYKDRDDSPSPEDFGGLRMGIAKGRNYHKFGFFGGIQF